MSRKHKYEMPDEYKASLVFLAVYLVVVFCIGVFLF